MSRFGNKLSFAFLLIFLLLITGVVGFHYIANLNWLDAAYMTVITASTVGFGEIHTLNEEARIFTMILIVANILVYAYAIKIITENMLSAQFIKNLMRKRMEKTVKKFNDHVILVGYGRNGKQAFQKLKTYGKKVVVIDKISSDLLMDQKSIFIDGDATEDEILIKAGIERASAIITTLGIDTDNLYVVLSARQLNPNITIISRASNENSAKKLKMAGAHNIISPHKIGGDFMASLLVTPGLVEFIQQLSVEDRNKRTNLEEISFDDCPNMYHDKSIATLDLRKLTGCTIIGYKDPAGEYFINPDAETVLVKGSTLIILGQPDQIEKLNDLFNIQ